MTVSNIQYLCTCTSYICYWLSALTKNYDATIQLLARNETLAVVTLNYRGV